MAANALFDTVTDAIEAESNLNRLEARGTLRIALKNAGLEADNVQPEQMRVAIQRVLLVELESRQIESPEALCARLVEVVDRAEQGGAGAHSDAPEDIFRRTRSTTP